MKDLDKYRGVNATATGDMVSEGEIKSNNAKGISGGHVQANAVTQ